MGLSKKHTVLIIIAVLVSATLVVATASGTGNRRVWELFSYVSPRPDTKMASAGTTIALRAVTGVGSDLIAHISIRATGSLSGSHEGRLFLAGDGQTIIFEPEQPFRPFELVHVLIDTGDGFREPGLPASVAYSFRVGPPAPEVDALDYLLYEARSAPQLGPTGVFTTETYVTAPADFPIFTVDTSGSGIANGYLFITYFNYSRFNDSQPYQLILDDQGQPIYYDRRDLSFDFKVQPNGNITYFELWTDQRRFVEINNQYQVVNIHQAGNGYSTDNHDLQLLDSGNWLLLADDARIIDMSQIVPGGDPEAIVVGCVVQEVDDAGNVLFEWNSFDHIPITDSNQDLTAGFIRYVHCNSIEPDDDSNLLMSSRHLSEVTKINRQSGDIIWRLGGKQNDFNFTNDPGFSFQHDARRLANGNLTIFDNRTGSTQLYSRAIDYSLDELNMTATLVREYRHVPDTYGPFMGNYSLLPNGNRLVGWGASSQPFLTEVNDADEVVFELGTGIPHGSYRVFRFPWEGHPPWAPVLVARQENANIKLYFSWNGSTDVHEYNVYGNPGTIPGNLLATVSKDGFETTYEFVPSGDGIHSFMVQARGAGSIPLAYSNVAYVIVGGSPVYLPIFKNNSS